MDERDTVSVIIPTWNRAGALEATVRSALAQTLAPAEVIVVDDGSTDGTEAVAGALPGGVRYLRQANAGVAAARNAGAAVATGRWLAFLDCEDAWAPEKLAMQLAAHRRHPDAAWSVSDCLAVGEGGLARRGARGFRRVFAFFRETGLDPARHFGAWLERAEQDGLVTFAGDLFGLLFHGNVCLPSSALVRRDLYEQLGGFDDAWRLAEETEFFHRLSAKARGMVLMSPLVRYRSPHAGSLSSPARAVALVEGALVSLERAARLRSPLSPAEREAHDRGRDRLLRRLAYAHLSNLEPASARESLAGLSRGSRGQREALVLAALGWFPRPALRGLRAVKRLVRR